MNLKYKLISFATSLALIGTMAANALAEKPSTPAAVKQPTITLTTSTPNIQVGQSVEIALSIDAQEEGFAGLSAFYKCAQTCKAFFLGIDGKRDIHRLPQLNIGGAGGQRYVGLCNSSRF